MTSSTLALAVLTFTLCTIAPVHSAGQAKSVVQPPKTYVDQTTGQLITRLSEAPGTKSLYFNRAAYTADQKDMIYSGPDGIYALNLQTLASSQLVSGKVRDIVVAPKTRRVFFLKKNDLHVYAIDIDSRVEAQVAILPIGAVLASVNANETALAGTVIEGFARDYSYYETLAINQVTKEMREARQKANANSSDAVATANLHAIAGDNHMMRAKEIAVRQRYKSKATEDLFTVDLRTGQYRVIVKGEDWLNYPRFSPTDPAVLMFTHEGPVRKIEKVWLVNVDGSGLKSLHKRLTEEEFVKAPFWSQDGTEISFFLHKQPKQGLFLVKYKVGTGKEKRFHLSDEDISTHYGSGPDSELFCGGGRSIAEEKIPAHVKRAALRKNVTNDNWLSLIHPMANGSASEQTDNADDGVVLTEHLVNLSANTPSMKFAPTCRITPDKKMVIFDSNMYGPTYLFAVPIPTSSK